MILFRGETSSNQSKSGLHFQGARNARNRQGKLKAVKGCIEGSERPDIRSQLPALCVVLRNYFFSIHSGLKKWWKLRQARAKKDEMDLPQWELDYKLEALPDHHMFWEYLEIGKCYFGWSRLRCFLLNTNNKNKK